MGIAGSLQPNEAYFLQNQKGEKIKQFLTFLLFLALVLQITANNINAQPALLFSDDFNDGTIDPFWIWWGKTVVESGGILSIQQNITDGGGYVTTSNFNPAKYVKVELKHYMHPGGDYFFPDISFMDTVSNRTVSIQWLKSSYPRDYCYTPTNFNKIMVKTTGAEKGWGNNCYAVSDIAASEYYDKWVISFITYEVETGNISLDIGGDGSVEFSAIVPEDFRNPINRISLIGYGWWTGHYHNFDWINIYTEELTEQTNNPPDLHKIGNKEVGENSVLEFTISATDVDGDNLNYTASNIPLGATFEGNTFSWTPSFDQAGSYKVLFITTDDGLPPLAATEEVTITVGNVNRPPEIATIGSQQVNEGITLSFLVNTSDPDGDSLQLAIGNQPLGSLFDPNTGEFSWTPNFDQHGNHYVTFSASDSVATVSQQMTITVANVNRPPVLTPIGDKIVNENEAIEFTVSGTDPDNNALMFSVPNLPPGASFDPNTQIFKWIPDYNQGGTYPEIEFTVMDTPDGDSTIELDTELITITVGNTNRGPIFVPVGSQTVLEKETLQFGVTANDPDGDTVSYTHSSLPEGASFDGTQLIWTPTLSQSGTYHVTFYATDEDILPIVSQLDIIINVGDVPTPCELSAQIIQAIETYNFATSVENSYMANMKKVCPFVEKGKFTPAINQLDAFIQKVEQDISHAEVSQSEGDTLLNMATNLKDTLHN